MSVKPGVSCVFLDHPSGGLVPCAPAHEPLQSLVSFSVLNDLIEDSVNARTLDDVVGGVTAIEDVDAALVADQTLVSGKLHLKPWIIHRTKGDLADDMNCHRRVFPCVLADNLPAPFTARF